MTTFTFSKFESDGVSSIASNVGGKIIQRIARPDLSDRIKPSRMADADSERVLQSQTGDPAAFEELVREHQRMVHALTFRMTGSLADAEDLAQETFLRAYEQISTFRGTAKFSTWLYRIAMNTCLNWRQSEARRFHLYENCADEMRAQNTHEEDFSVKNNHHNYIQSSLLRLPAKQRAAIVLTIYDGLNHAEAAQILGCSETTISWRVFTAKRKLKNWLSRNGDMA
jgi:RNA polymerase sigma-70 factor (ECF subfamily)